MKLLRMGRLKKGGGGCMCPENAFVRSLMNHMVFQQGQDVLMDMEAGVEHLGRGTARGVDMMLAVVNPGQKSIQTAHNIRELAGEIGVDNLAVIINRYHSDREVDAVRESLRNLPVIGTFPHDENIAAADIKGECPYTGSAGQANWAGDIMKNVTQILGE